MRKVLILEDEEVLGRLYKKHLEAAGYEVQWYATVQEIREAAPHFAADVALIDHGLKGEEDTGIVLIPFLKGLYPDIKLIMLSNYNHQTLQKKALERGADMYLVKINAPPKLLLKYMDDLFSKPGSN